MLTVKLVFTALGVASSSSAAAGAAMAKPPTGITGASGKFNRLFKTWLSSDTSKRLRLVISETIFSILAETGLSTPSGTGTVRGAAAWATSCRRTTLKYVRHVCYLSKYTIIHVLRHRVTVKPKELVIYYDFGIVS